MTQLPPDDSLMSRFDEQGLRRFRARDALLATGLVCLLLALLAGPSVRGAAERMEPGIGRDLVMLVGKPLGWVGDKLPIAGAVDDATAWLSPDEGLDEGASFTAVSQHTGQAGGVPLVTPDAFAPADIGAQAPQRRPLGRLLVTGDSMATPLDAELARRMADTDVRVTREPHLGTGISKEFVVDWGQLSTRQVRKHDPDAVVVFIGANEGFPMTGAGDRKVECCDAAWAAEYANRARRMMDTYRRAGDARVYWITIPTARAAARARIGRVVNAAVGVAAQPWRAHVRVIDTVPTFTPEGYRDAMPVEGVETIVRQADGIHLNEDGASLLADALLREVGRDFTY